MAQVTKHKEIGAFRVEFEREGDGRWIAEIPNISGALAYGNTKTEAARKVGSIIRTLSLTV